ncbi:phage tail assembly chaperone [Paracoccus sp. J56]|uniref:phage tail assembly chaperone n=1 Tax=Paracoccus sp. J56 TaxID=935850 RepID=UPI0015944130|nr:phage tail assembly chaperone [Paracoccus sp. J56]
MDDLPGGIPGAWDSVMRQTYTGIRGVLLATATDRAAAFSLLASLSNRPLASFTGHAQAACLDLLRNLIPKPDEGEAHDGKLITLGEYLDELFRFATVILQWPPSEIWQASPAEIEAVLKGHLERLEAIENTTGNHQLKTGSSTAYTPDRLKEVEELGYDPTFDRQALRALKARHNA